MSVHESQFTWSDAQWRRVLEAVQDEASQARVAASFLPEVGPLPASAEVIPSELLNSEDDKCDPCREDVKKDGQPRRFRQIERLAVDDVSTTRFLKIQVDVHLTEQQMAEEDMPSALLMFRRAANIIARLEDALIFNGRETDQSMSDWISRWVPGIEPVFSITGFEEYTDYRESTDVNGDPIISEHVGTRKVRGLMDLPIWAGVDGKPEGEPDIQKLDFGEGLVKSISDAIGTLEGWGHLGPFACTLGNGFFSDVNTPVGGTMVLPRDRIEPWLGNPLNRTSTIADLAGVIVSLSGNPIDIVRASPITVQFLQLTREPRYVFRTYERFALRIKEQRPGLVMLPELLLNLPAGGGGSGGGSGSGGGRGQISGAGSGNVQFTAK